MADLRGEKKHGETKDKLADAVQKKKKKKKKEEEEEE
jgi:hypothetical protein